MDDLLQDFIAETREMLAAIADEIVAWEADPSNRARLDEIFRFVHTVKGSCLFLDLPRLAQLSHAAEDVLGELRAGKRVATTALVSAVLGVVDRIGELTEAIGAGASLPDAEDQRLIAALAVGAAPAASPGGQAAPAAPDMLVAARAPPRAVRLPIDLLDRMMAGMSDMVLARDVLARRLRETGADTALEAAFGRLSGSVAAMHDVITRARMQRIDTVFAVLPRLVRDLSIETGKPVTLDVDGGDAELDREMIEMIRDPLIHLLRNAIGHGIEAPEDRRRAGKPAAGRLVVSARRSGDQILIEVADDGRGIDAAKVVSRAVAAGIVSTAEAAAMSPAREVELIFVPGVSTADVVTTLSGRGVGMDVVRANVERIGGKVEVESRPGAGSRFVLRVPLTPAIDPALSPEAKAAEQVPTLLFRDLDGVERGIRFALVERIEEAPAGAIVRRAGGTWLAHADGLAPLLGCRPIAEGAATTVLWLTDGATTCGYAIDGVIDLRDPDARATPAAGRIAGMLREGRPVELIDPFDLFAEATRVASALPAERITLRADVGDAWTREVLRPLIEAAGYEVRFADPGEAADLAIADAAGVSPPGVSSGTPVLRLRADPDPAGDPASVYRYDRDAVMGAVRRRLRAGRG